MNQPSLLLRVLTAVALTLAPTISDAQCYTDSNGNVFCTPSVSRQVVRSVVTPNVSRTRTVYRGYDAPAFSSPSFGGYVAYTQSQPQSYTTHTVTRSGRSGIVARSRARGGLLGRIFPGRAQRRASRQATADRYGGSSFTPAYGSIAYETYSPPTYSVPSSGSHGGYVSRSYAPATQSSGSHGGYPGAATQTVEESDTDTVPRVPQSKRQAKAETPKTEAVTDGRLVAQVPQRLTARVPSRLVATVPDNRMTLVAMR